MAALITKLSQLPARVLILLVRGYRFFLSPWLGSACRFEPTCSAYSLQAWCVAAPGARVAMTRCPSTHRACLPV
jgi:putative membrane protein insertion efficiency factor